MSNKEKFINLLKRNFSEKTPIYVGINKKFYNKKHPENKFARDFEEAKYTIDTLVKVIPNLMTKFDLYINFTPVVNERKKANAQGSFIVGHDIDGVPIPTDLPPSYYWETSPNKYQGVWVLDNELSPKEHEELKRKMIEAHGFDKTGADIVHYLRIPNTYNYKYASPFRVSGILGEGTVYRKNDIINYYKKIKPAVYVSGDISEEAIPLKKFKIENLIEKYGIQGYYKGTEGLDRSSWSWRLGQTLVSKGATKEETKFLILNAPSGMSKFNVNTVDAEVHRIFTKTEPRKELKKTHEVISPKKLKKEGKAETASLKVVKVNEIEPYDEKDFWLVEDLWQNESVGIVGAPSKSFKSTFTLNLACAVATGKDFDGRKVKQGGVLIVQGENSLSIEQHKIYAITGETDLPIYFVDSAWDMTKVRKLLPTIKELGIKLLIIDPMYLLFGNGDINKHNDITERLRSLSDLRDETGCSVMLVHHSRKLERGAKIQTNDMYGSSFIEGWYESMILLQRSGVTSSKMTTYFRNHRSGDKYTLLVNDNMGCRVTKDRAEEDYEVPEMGLDSILPKDN